MIDSEIAAFLQEYKREHGISDDIIQQEDGKRQ